MNELQVFNNPAFGQIRTIEENGKILFCGSDVAKALGYANAPDALNRHCRAIVKRDTPISGKMQKINFIPEGDIYRLAAKSELPGADKFESWIFDEVIPSIRKTGGYSVKKENPRILAEAEAKLNNSRARVSGMWLKIAQLIPANKEYQNLCASYASKALAGHEVLPLPECTEHLYTATEVGKIFGVSSQRIGKLANNYGLKVEEYGKIVWDKSPYSNKQVEAFRYNDKAITRIGELIGQKTA